MVQRWIGLAVTVFALWLAPRVAAACPGGAPVLLPEAPCPAPEASHGPVDKRFLAFPYAKGHPTYVVASPESDWSREGRDFAGRITAEGGALPGPRGRIGTSIRASYSFLSVDTSWHLVGDLVGKSDLVFGETNASLAWRGQHVIARFGGGVRYASLGPLRSHGRKWAGGWNLTSSIDAFPIRPLVLSGQLDFGRVGSAWASHGRATAGLVFRGVELYGGFDGYLQGTIALGGPVVGLRLWI